MEAKLIVITLLSLCACSQESIESTIFVEPESIRVFKSAVDLTNAITNPKGGAIVTKGETSIPCNLFSRLEEVDINNDPILSYEMMAYEYEEGDNSKTLYQILGYDELVPNENFARLMNARGEFQVGDTIYKVSPKGTYYFPSESRMIFESEYSELENSKGVLIKDKTYQLAPNIYRYDTFGEVIEDTEVETKVFPIPGFENYSYYTYTGSVNLVLNNQLHYKTMSSNRRVKTRVYNHDYVVYQERGAYVKVQKKATIGWKDMVASELSLGWNNIIMTKEYEMGLNQPLPGSSPRWLGVTTEIFNDNEIEVGEISGYSIPSNSFGTIVNGNGITLFSKIYNDTGIFIMNCDAVRLYGFDKVQLITLPQYITRNNTDEVKVQFTSNVLSPSYKFAAGQFFFVGKDGSLTGALRVGTDFQINNN